jgi:hypothetical protein
MGLHEALKPGVLWNWRWYNAYVRRAGRTHLLRVPVVRREIINVPTWIYRDYERDEYIRNEQSRPDLYHYPGLLGPDFIQRYCTSQQQAESWVYRDWQSDWRTWAQPTRGICQVCQSYALTLPAHAIDGPSGVRQSQGPRGLYSSEAIENWIRYAQGHRDE